MADDVTSDIAGVLRSIWWLPVLRGALLLVLGLVMFAAPLTTVSALVWVFGVFAVADGIVAIGQGLANRAEAGFGWWIAEGLAGIVFGAVVVLWPGATALVVFYLLALWVLVLGILTVVVAIVRYRAQDPGWTWVLVWGLVSFLFGLLLVTKPQDTVAVVVVVFGLFAFVAGILLVVAGFATRSIAKQLAEARPPLTP